MVSRGEEAGVNRSVGLPSTKDPVAAFSATCKILPPDMPDSVLSGMIRTSFAMLRNAERPDTR